MIRVLLFVVGLAGLLLVWAICGPILFVGDLFPPTNTLGGPTIYDHFIWFDVGNFRLISIHVTPWAKAIAATVAIIYSTVFVLFTASLFRRKH